MGIERGPATGHANATAAQRPGAAAKAGGQAAGSDFLALMAALEDGLGLQDGDAAALLPGAAKGGGKHGKPAAELPPADALPADPAALALLLPVPPTATAEAALPRPAAVAADAAAAKAAVPPDGGRAAHAAADGPATAAAPGAAAPATAAGDPRLAPQYASVFEQLQQHLAAREPAVPEPALRQAPGDQQGRALRDPARAERSAMLPLAGAARADALPAVVADVAAASGGTGARSGGRDSAGEGAGQQGSPHGAAGWAAPDFTPTVQYDAALASLDPAAQPDTAFDRQLADQLRHWASQGVHSAELTVGTSEPVQVRIALDGNEAQVQFRAEHAATREMLAGTVDQLRELLGAQGLVLSGVSVGGHGAGTGHDQAGDGTGAGGAPLRQPRAPAEPVGDAAAAAPRRNAGVLDLYV